MRLIDADAFKEYMRKALEETRDCYPDKGEWAEAITEQFCKDIDDQPTIEPQRWVPVTERLPEEDGEYLVACSTAKGKPCVHDIETFANDLYQVDKYEFSDKKGQKGWAYLHDEYGYIEDQTVVAWMPLPEPYRED